MANYKNGIITRSKILQVSKRLFYLNGYKDTKVEMIASYIDKPKSLINYHFKRKIDIFVEVFNDFQNTIYDYVQTDYPDTVNFLTKYFLYNRIYYHLLHHDEHTIKLTKEVLDKKVLNYEDFVTFYSVVENLIDYSGNKISEKRVRLKTVSIIGGNREILEEYYRDKLEMDLEEIIDEISINSAKILGILNLDIYESLKKSKELFNELDNSKLAFFLHGDKK